MNHLDLNVNDEWSPLRTAIFHDAENVIDWSPTAVVNHPEQGPVRKAVFIEQHAWFRQLLERAGVRLITPATQADALCQAFTRDPSFVIADTLFISRMHEKYRRLETPGLAEIRSQVARHVALDRGDIEGGDVMVLREDLVLVGTGDITTTEGVAALRSVLETQGVKVVRVPHHALHLDCCLAPLPNKKCLISEGRLPPAARGLLRPFFAELLPLPAEEDLRYLSANMLWLNPDEVVSTTHAPETNRVLRIMGYAVHEVQYSEVIRLWGSVRCTVSPMTRIA